MTIPITFVVIFLASLVMRKMTMRIADKKVDRLNQTVSYLISSVLLIVCLTVGLAFADPWYAGGAVFLVFATVLWTSLIMDIYEEHKQNKEG